MNSTRLTTRGKIVLAVSLIAVFWALISVVTPNECKVPAGDMSVACKSLMFS